MKIKIFGNVKGKLGLTKTQWDLAINHAAALGAFSRDGQYGYRPDKNAMTLDGYFIKYSSPTAKPTNSPVDMKISYSEFMSMSTLNNGSGSNVKARPTAPTPTAPTPTGISKAECDRRVEKAARDAADGAVAVMEVMSPIAQATLKVVDVKILAQNPIVFAAQGIDALKDLGVDIVTHDGKNYIIDTATNTADEVTPDMIAKKAKADFLDGKVTAYTTYAKDFDLIESMTHGKVLNDDSAED